MIDTYVVAARLSGILDFIKLTFLNSNPSENETTSQFKMNKSVHRSKFGYIPVMVQIPTDSVTRYVNVILTFRGRCFIVFDVNLTLSTIVYVQSFYLFKLCID